MVKATGFAAVAATLASVASAGMQSPTFPANAFWSQPMGSPPAAQAKYTFTSPQTGAPVDYFEMDMKPLTRKQYPNLGATRMLGYNGSMPGTSYRIQPDVRQADQ